MKRVLIFGVGGQDGTLLAEALKAQAIDYLGVDRRGLISGDGRLFQAGTLTDSQFIQTAVESFSPTHVFYLAAHHHSSQDARASDEAALWTSSVAVQVLGLAHTLNALKRKAPGARLFYASSSHVFGSPTESRQNENTPKIPNNVYGITKLAGMETCRYFREQHGMFASVGILYNHESVHRQAKFLSKKVILAASAIKEGHLRRLVLGNLSAEVDWGYAPDYVDAMIRILNHDRPDTYVIATGEAHTVRELVQIAFEYQGLDYREWVDEDASLTQGSTVRLIGDSSKLRRETGWAPSVSFPEMIRCIAEQASRPDLISHE